jgi:hypothetical protein
MLDEQEPKAWDQLPGESNSAYARFLIYRNLGPARTLDAAYQSTVEKSKKKQSISGQWTKDSTVFDWIRRADAWDIDILRTNGRKVVLLFIRGLERVVTKSVATLEKDGIEPETWSAAVNALHTVGQYIPAEASREVQSDRDADREPAGVG